MPGRTRIVLIATLGAALAVAGIGTAAGEKLGKPPRKCGAGFGGGLSGCYGRDVGPNVMDDMNQAELTISPHIVTRGQTITATLNSVFSDARGYSLDVPGQKLSCPHATVQGATVCTANATSPTGGWARANFSFSGGVEQDFFAVLPKDKAAISGTIVDAEDKPMKGVRVAISGEEKPAVTDAQGFYFALVDEGSHTVTPAAKVCLVPSSKECKRSATVKTPPSRNVSFKKGGEFDISGIVREGCSDCGTSEPLEGATVVATPKGAGQPGQGTTDQDGHYSIDLVQGTYDVKLATPPNGTPKATRVKLHRNVGGVDFRVCDAAAATTRMNPWAYPAANQTTKFEWQGRGGCPEQKFIVTHFRNTERADRLKLNWTAGFRSECPTPVAAIERSIDLVPGQFDYTIEISPRTASNPSERPAEGSVTLRLNAVGRSIVGATITAARVTVTLDQQGQCSAGLASDEHVDVPPKKS